MEEQASIWVSGGNPHRILSLGKTLIVHLQEPWPQIARRTMQLSLKQQHCSYHSNVLIFIFHYLFFCGMFSLLVHIFDVWIYMCYKFQCLLYYKTKTVVWVCFHYFFQYFSIFPGPFLNVLYTFSLRTVFRGFLSILCPYPVWCSCSRQVIFLTFPPFFSPLCVNRQNLVTLTTLYLELI